MADEERKPEKTQLSLSQRMMAAMISTDQQVRKAPAPEESSSGKPDDKKIISVIENRIKHRQRLVPQAIQHMRESAGKTKTPTKAGYGFDETVELLTVSDWARQSYCIAKIAEKDSIFIESMAEKKSYGQLTSELLRQAKNPSNLFPSIYEEFQKLTHLGKYVKAVSLIAKEAFPDEAGKEKEQPPTDYLLSLCDKASKVCQQLLEGGVDLSRPDELAEFRKTLEKAPDSKLKKKVLEKVGYKLKEFQQP